MVFDAALAQQLKESEDSYVRSGGEVLEKQPEVGDRAPRRCQDGIWAFFFVCLTVYITYMALDSKSQELFSSNKKYIYPLLTAFTVAALTGLAMETLCKRFTTAFVYVSLYFVPVLMFLSGILLAVLGRSLMEKLLGGGCILAGLIFVGLIRCCWADLIPPTVKTVETVCGVVEGHPQLYFVAAFGSIMIFVWGFLWLSGAAAIYLLHNARIAEFSGDVNNTMRGILFVFALGWFWGIGIVLNVCQVTNCGVFGRWYYAQDDTPGANPVVASLKAATTSSFGSICFGSFCVAFFQAMHVVAKALRQAAEEEGNVVLCILYCIIESVIRCIGDIIEWFCTYAYVQCAVRGLSFLDSVRATYALCVWANIPFIVSGQLVDTVVSFGAFVCCVTAALATFAMGAGYESVIAALAVGGNVGFIFLLPLRSGSVTFAVCFAEAPEKLSERKPELYASYRKLLNAPTEDEEGRSSVEMQRPSGSEQPSQPAPTNGTV